MPAADLATARGGIRILAATGAPDIATLLDALASSRRWRDGNDLGVRWPSRITQTRWARPQIEPADRRQLRGQRLLTGTDSLSMQPPATASAVATCSTYQSPPGIT